MLLSKYLLLLLLATVVSSRSGFGGYEFGSSTTATTQGPSFSHKTIKTDIGKAELTASVKPDRPPQYKEENDDAPTPSPAYPKSPAPHESPIPTESPLVPKSSPFAFNHPSPSEYPSPPSNYPSPSPVERDVPVDYSSTASTLRTKILQGDVRGAAKVISSARLNNLAAGLMYPSSLAHLVQKTRDRNSDPDVVAFKALAQAALDTGDTFKLAAAVVASFVPDCQCSAYTINELDNLTSAFMADFQNRAELRRIIAADLNKEHNYRDRKGYRHLMSSSPSSSFVCSYCWPGQQCNKMHWC